MAWRRVRRFLLLIPALALVAGVAGYFGGVEERDATRQAAVTAIAQAQYDQGLADLAAGRYSMARQRFEYVIRLDPGFPGAADRLVEALVNLDVPTTSAGPTATPTPNLAPVQELFTQAQAAFAEGNWTRTIETLLALRAKDPAFRAVEVDGLMYASLRSRGLDLIRTEWQLEPGLYDLSRAERFGPLDKDASDWQTSARYYLQANSYMGLRWGLSTDLFLDICVPAGLWDSCNKTTLAAQRSAEQLTAMADADPCGIQAEFEQWGWPLDLPILQPVYDVVGAAAEECIRRNPPPTPTPEVTPTETPTSTPPP
jgi:tetratricopeptide (TPR) repeat protein